MRELYCERVGYITLNQEYYATLYQIKTSINRDDADQNKWITLLPCNCTTLAVIQFQCTNFVEQGPIRRQFLLDFKLGIHEKCMFVMEANMLTTASIPNIFDSV